jgi:hypothetical protein
MDYSFNNIDGKKVNALSYEIARNESAEKHPPNKFTIIGGHLEEIIQGRDHPSREPLVWQNAFFGPEILRCRCTLRSWKRC